MDRRTFLSASLAFATLAGAAAPVPAGEVMSFDLQTFAAAQEAGEGIVIFVHAPW